MKFYKDEVMAIILRGCGKALPKRVLTNIELARKIDTSDEWIRSHTGIGQRYIAEASEKASDFAVSACKNAMEISGVKSSDINCIAISTATPNYIGVPSTACVVQRDLGCENAAAFDLSAACSGFMFGLDMVCGLMERHGWAYALVCGSEVLSKIVDWEDRGTCILFGDGAGAVVLENTLVTGRKTYEGQGFGRFILGSQGSGAEALYTDDFGKLKMDGHGVYNFAVQIMAKTLQDLMDAEDLKIDDVDYFLCHQANERILRAAAKRGKIPLEKVIINLENYGNVSSACIPITLTDYLADERIKEGMTIVSAAFGAGLTWAGCVLRV